MGFFAVLPYVDDHLGGALVGLVLGLRRQASEPVLDTLARVLWLDDGERAYMRELSGRDAARPRRRTTQMVKPQLQRLLDDLSTTPALVLDRRTDILAWNPMNPPCSPTSITHRTFDPGRAFSTPGTAQCGEARTGRSK